MTRIYRIILTLIAFLAFGTHTLAAGERAEQWDGLLEVTCKFSWYPREDLRRLLEMKGAEYGQSLEEYRDLLLSEITGEEASPRINPDRFRSGLPWRTYYRLSLAEFSLYLADDLPIHLQNAEAALSVLAKKTGQPEIEFWNYVYGAHRACQKQNRDTFIAEIFRIWQNVILPFELETLLFPSDAAQSGFVRNLPYLYENVAHLVVRKAIAEKELSQLYPLGAVILDIQPKLTLENGYQTMLAQVVERMRGVNSDNGNLNFAVALLEATANRYDFEDEKDELRLQAKYNAARKFYQLAAEWADTGKGKAAILAQEMGFMNYLIGRFGERPDLLLTKSYFNDIPSQANENLKKAFAFFDRLAAPEIKDGGFTDQGFEDRETYLQSMHQLIDSGAKLSIVLSGFHRTHSGPEPGRNIYPAARPLQQYCDLFARHARSDSEALPDNAYFLAAYAARELAGLFRDHTRYSTDDRASALAFAYQLQAAELFPLDLPGILQLAFQSTQDGRVRDYVRFSTPLAARLRSSADAGGWPERHPGEFAPLVTLMPTIVPEVIDNAFTFLRHFPQEEIAEESLFVRSILMARTLADLRGTESQEVIDEQLSAIGGRDFRLESPAGSGAALQGIVPQGEESYLELKSRLYGAPDNPLHTLLRTLFHEVPYESHPYVALLQDLR